ncbi:MAG: hypothetical protein HGB17_10755 [Syntrophobacteraceae bacterium]|nr:hypothetical protein [Syntrophobacteraceae bacterium]
MDKDHLPYFLTAVFGPAKRLVQLGAVGINAAFGAIKNPIRDTIERAVYGRANSSPVETFTMGFWEELRKGNAAELWKDLGGEISTLMGQDRIQARSHLEESLAETKGEKAKQIALHPLDAMRTLFGFYEAAPRIAEFKAVLKKAEGKYGVGSIDARIEAMLASKDVTTNFTRGGIIATALNGMIPFFNAQIQGSSKFVRAFSGADGKGYAVRALGHAAAYITIPTLLLAFINKDEDWYEELQKWERLAFWHFSLDGGKTIVRIPKPFQLGYVFGSVPQELFLSAYKQSPELMADALWETIKGFVPVNNIWDLAPALLKPGMEAWSNYDSFRERQIVPAYEERYKMPMDQYGRYQTEASKWIGAMLNVSPRKVEHVMSGYTGAAATNTTRLVESLVGVRKEIGRQGGASELPVVGTLFSRNPFYNGRSVSKMYEMRDELAQKKGSRRLSGAEREQLDRLEFAAERISIIRKRMDAGRIDQDEAAKKITSIARRSIGLERLE